MKNFFSGKWRLTAMDLWDTAGLEAEDVLELDRRGRGSFRFGALSGEMDCRIERVGGMERLEFSWEGGDDMNPVSGRGWAMIENDELRGRLYFHLGDDSGFRARRLEEKRPSPAVRVTKRRHVRRRG